MQSGDLYIYTNVAHCDTISEKFNYNEQKLCADVVYGNKTQIDIIWEHDGKFCLVQAKVIH